jgi:hypothetical protein
MRSRAVRALALVVALALVALALAELIRLRAERDDARAALASVSSSVLTSKERLDLMTESRARYQRLADHRRDVVDGLRDQVDWDKSHLLDCWTAIVRVVPSPTMRRIFGGPLGYLADAARDGGVLAHYVRRCAADAVP